MGRVTVYLDEQTEKQLNRIVKSLQVPKSKWIADLIREKTSLSWPDAVEELAGSLTGFPSLEEIRASEGIDVPREKL